MTDTRRTAIAAPTRWIDATDAVLRGLAHQLSNRTGTIGAVAEALAASEPSRELAAVLGAEAERLEALLRLLRLLPRDLARGPEPVRPADVVADAAALFAQHEAGRGTAVAMMDLDRTPPARVCVPALTHALVVLFAAAAGDDGASVSVRGEDVDGAARLTVTGAAAAGPDALAAAEAATAIVVADGVTVVADGAANGGPAFILSLPSLHATHQ
ncbi:MAG: hypothetical protein ACYC2G_12595 [Gemmatimonadaceae bacterium]